MLFFCFPNEVRIFSSNVCLYQWNGFQASKPVWKIAPNSNLFTFYHFVFIFQNEKVNAIRIPLNQETAPAEECFDQITALLKNTSASTPIVFNCQVRVSGFFVYNFQHAETFIQIFVILNLSFEFWYQLVKISKMSYKSPLLKILLPSPILHSGWYQPHDHSHGHRFSRKGVPAGLWTQPHEGNGNSNFFKSGYLILIFFLANSCDFDGKMSMILGDCSWRYSRGFEEEEAWPSRNRHRGRCREERYDGWWVWTQVILYYVEG